MEIDRAYQITVVSGILAREIMAIRKQRQELNEHPDWLYRRELTIEDAIKRLRKLLDTV